MSYQRKVSRVRAKYDILSDSISECEKALEEKNVRLQDVEEARNIINTIAQKIQKKVSDTVTGQATEALRAVYGDEYKLKLEYETKRGKSEAQLNVLFRDMPMNIRRDVGGGIVDLTAFAMRLVLWRLGSPRTEAELLLDEPFKFISRDKLEGAIVLLQKVSQRLNVQMIIVTHMGQLVEAGDCAFDVSLKGSRSVVKQISGGKTHDKRSKSGTGNRRST